MSDPKTHVSTETLLREAMQEHVDALAPRFDGFVQSVLTQLDADLPPEPERVLRADEASLEELADAKMFDEEGYELAGAALRAEAEAELEAVDWAAFAAGVDDALDGEALAPDVAVALREEADEAVAAREGEWSDFSAAVMAKLPAETVTVAELLTEHTEAELAAREGEWRAFSARVFEAVDAEARQTDRAPLEEQAIAALRADVESEVEAMSPSFGERFKKDVEKEIFKSAQQPDPWWTRAWAWCREMFAFEGGYGLAAAAATAVLLVAITGLPPGEAPRGEPVTTALPGEVAVDSLSFEGDVTVMPEDGITIVWLDAPT